MAIRTHASRQGALRTTAHWDLYDAPKGADRQCEEHGAQLLASLARSIGKQP